MKNLLIQQKKIKIKIKKAVHKVINKKIIDKKSANNLIKTKKKIHILKIRL